ncbi:hypothetical protein V6N13_127612 [Hibiscus sabdariffa]|uniref:Uncharacterized protein n=1 Tax=Hibiscus sabdariffa TaxID=183260 RepID=A0ABR2CF37_9ROSI
MALFCLSFIHLHPRSALLGPSSPTPSPCPLPIFKPEAQLSFGGVGGGAEMETAPDDNHFSAFSTTHFSILTIGETRLPFRSYSPFPIVSKKKREAADESLEAHMSEEEETIFSHAIIICEDDDDSW